MATEAGQVSGALFLDREPRTTHLRNKTREAPEEREKLRAYLTAFDPPVATRDASPTAAGGSAS